MYRGRILRTFHIAVDFKLFCTKRCVVDVGGRGGGSSISTDIYINIYRAAGKLLHIKLITYCTVRYRIQKLLYIKLPMYLFFIRCFDLIF